MILPRSPVLHTQRLSHQGPRLQSQRCLVQAFDDRAVIDDTDTFGSAFHWGVSTAPSPRCRPSRLLLIEATVRKRVAPVVHGAMYGAELTGGNADWVSSRCMPVIALVTAQKSSVGWRLLPRPIPQIFSNNSAAHPPCRRHRQSARSSRATHQRCSRNIAMILNGHFRWPSINPTLRQGKPPGSPREAERSVENRDRISRYWPTAPSADRTS